MATKAEPGAFDCHANAKMDEPLFTLLARDAQAPALVRLWATAREKLGENPDKVAEARQVAVDMESWYRANKGEYPTSAIMKAAIGVEDYKVERFMNAITTAGYSPTKGPGITDDTKFIYADIPLEKADEFAALLAKLNREARGGH